MTFILDFDGTIGDSKDLIVKTMQQTIKQMSLPQRTDSQCAATIGLPLNSAFVELFDVDKDTAELYTKKYREIFELNNVPGAVRMFPNVHDTISSLHSEGIAFTIASSRRSSSVKEYLREMELEEYISYIVCSDNVEQAKPAPDMVVKTLEHLCIEPKDAIVVGDTIYDIEMAHNAGVRAVGVTYGNGTLEELKAAKAEWIIDDFKDIKRVLINR